MYDQTKPYVTAHSSDEKICAVINAWGDARPYWRKHDWPKQGENNTRLWVKPGDIGLSRRDTTALLERLKQMTREGKLEMRYHSNMPRFRVDDTPAADKQLPRELPRANVYRPKRQPFYYGGQSQE